MPNSGGLIHGSVGRLGMQRERDQPTADARCAQKRWGDPRRKTRDRGVIFHRMFPYMWKLLEKCFFVQKNLGPRMQAASPFFSGSSAVELGRLMLSAFAAADNSASSRKNRVGARREHPGQTESLWTSSDG